MKLLVTTKYHVLTALLTAVAAILYICDANGANPDKYAETSMLAKGKWVKIDVTTPGLQTITAQKLKNFGFSNPEKVNVYGYGGRMVPEVLSADQPDDLPMQPVVRNAGGLTFYAVGNHTWEASASGAQMRYSHTFNPYCETSYYFLSDVAIDNPPAQEIDLSDIKGMTVMSTFVEHLVHEKDLMQCAVSGREYLGEDFRLNKSQNFDFELPDNAGGNASVRIRFAANTNGAPSSILISANGTRLPSTSTDNIKATTSSEQFYNVTTTTKSVTDAGESLRIGIEYTQGGVVNMARLDWIEVEYERSLALRDGVLAMHVNPTSPTAYRISGTSPSTLIWDVTDPARPHAVKGIFDPQSKTHTFGINENGYREFIVFEPTVRGAVIPGRFAIGNQDLHSLPVPDMLIISPDQYLSAAERIADLHRTHDGMTVHVLTPEKIYNEFSSGNADLSAYRKILKMWYDRAAVDTTGHRIRHCLIMGRPTYDQKIKNQETQSARYPRPLIWQSANGLSESSSYCTDDYIGMLEDETRVRNMWDREISIGVGRCPVMNLQEAELFAEKLETYVKRPDFGSWRNNVLVIADDDDNNAHLKQAQRSIDFMMQSEAGSHYAYERLYLDSFELKMTGTGKEYPEATAKLLRKWEKEGVALINYVGHANPKEWGHEKLLTWTQINDMTNQQLPILYAPTCSFGAFDSQEQSGAEVMLFNPAGGVATVVTPSRSVYISLNEKITDKVATQIFRRGSDGKGQSIGDVMKNAKNTCTDRSDNMLRYHIIGDPALRINVPGLEARIDSLGGQPLPDSIDDAPVLQARSKVKISGRIIDSDGNTVDFNGPVLFTLFDAEVSVETHGNGKNGEKTVYQDRLAKLATGVATARNGEWATTILMPAEITGNYTPARLTIYAYDSESGSEANGSTENLYVYGYDEKSGDDLRGPDIHSFYINNQAFATGDMVHGSSVALATVADESGINISDAGLGHKMTLTLDNKKVFDDVSNFFTPDPYTPGAGTIAYPLQNLEPGNHELTLTVWDNANNSSDSSLSFIVGLNMEPQFVEYNAYYNHDFDQLTLRVTTDRVMCKLDTKFECHDISGAKVWETEKSCYAGKDSDIGFTWDLRDSNGHRLPRGIYIIKATVAGDDGMTATQSKKFAIP